MASILFFVGLLLQGLVSAARVSVHSCGSAVLTIGQDCTSSLKNGDRACDTSCSSIVSARPPLSPCLLVDQELQLVCHDGKMQLNNACGQGHCIWREDAKSAYCSGPSTEADRSEVEGDIEEDAQEHGGVRADDEVDHDVEDACHEATNRDNRVLSSAEEDTGKDGLVESPKLPPSCGFVQQLGHKCSILISEGARLCDNNCQNLVSPAGTLG